MFFVYLLKSEKDGSFYIGQTNNPDRRISDHNKGYSKYTKSKVPWSLTFIKKFDTRSEAVLFETKLKSFKNKEYLTSFLKLGDRVPM